VCLEVAGLERLLRAMSYCEHLDRIAGDAVECSVGQPLATAISNFSKLELEKVILCGQRATQRIGSERFELVQKAVVPRSSNIRN
jgi:hypothetical protein